MRILGWPEYEWRHPPDCKTGSLENVIHNIIFLHWDTKCLPPWEWIDRNSIIFLLIINYFYIEIMNLIFTLRNISKSYYCIAYDIILSLLTQCWKYTISPILNDEAVFVDCLKIIVGIDFFDILFSHAGGVIFYLRLFLVLYSIFSSRRSS